MHRGRFIRKFINCWTDLQTEHNDSIIYIFFETIQSVFGTFNIPPSMSSFLRYYIYNEKNDGNKPIRTNTQSVYFSGVGTSSLISSIVGDSKKKTGDG